MLNAIKKEADVVVGLDVGSHTIKVVTAYKRRPGLITGAKSNFSAGVYRGEVYDEQAATRSIREAFQKALATQGKIKNVCLGVCGYGLLTFHAKAKVNFKKKRKLHKNDIDRLLQKASQLALPPGQRVIQVVPQRFYLNENLAVKTPPTGMVASYLSCEAKVITVNKEGINRWSSLVSDVLGLKVTQVFLNVLAAAAVTLGEVEKQLGAVLVDLGGSVTGLGVFKDGFLHKVDVLPVGGAHITSDLAIGLGTTLAYAEDLKQKIGLLGGEEHKKATYIIRARVEEILALLKERIEEQNDNVFYKEVVLTGGGALLKGLPELVADYLQVCTRVGLPLRKRFPAGVEPGPAWCVGIGLVTGDLNC